MKVWVRSNLRSRRINRGEVARFATLAMRRAGFPADAELSVLFVGAKAMRRLNLTYRGVDRDTDVLAFPLGERGLAGDVVVSLDMALRRARGLRTTVGREILLYLAHGILHLRGLDDADRKGSEAMERRQEAILREALEKRRWNVTG